MSSSNVTAVHLWFDYITLCQYQPHVCCVDTTCQTHFKACANHHRSGAPNFVAGAVCQLHMPVASNRYDTAGTWTPSIFNNSHTEPPHSDRDCNNLAPLHKISQYRAVHQQVQQSVEVSLPTLLLRSPYLHWRGLDGHEWCQIGLQAGEHPVLAQRVGVQRIRHQLLVQPEPLAALLL